MILLPLIYFTGPVGILTAKTSSPHRSFLGESKNRSESQLPGCAGEPKNRIPEQLNNTDAVVEEELRPPVRNPEGPRRWVVTKSNNLSEAAGSLASRGIWKLRNTCGIVKTGFRDRNPESSRGAISFVRIMNSAESPNSRSDFPDRLRVMGKLHMVDFRGEQFAKSGIFDSTTTTAQVKGRFHILPHRRRNGREGKCATFGKYWHRGGVNCPEVSGEPYEPGNTRGELGYPADH